MSFKRSFIFSFLLVTSLYFLVKTQAPIIIYPVKNNITQYCQKNTFYFEFPIRFSQKLDKIIPFEMLIPQPNKFPFKCAINGPKSKLECFHSFSNHVWSLSDNTRVELPYSFPNIEGIRWDYDSFLTNIYRYLWRTQGNCGLEFENLNPEESISEQISKDLNKGKEKKIDIIANIEDISGGECHSSQYDYSFNMYIELTGGEIVDQLNIAKTSSKNMKLNFLHNIYVPILIGEKKQKGITSFRKDYEYKYATCRYESEINQNNFGDAEGIILTCNLKINKYIRFQGPLQIKPFTDNIYASISDKDGKIITSMLTIQFDILYSSTIGSNEEKEEGEESKEKKKEENNEEKKPEEITTSKPQPSPVLSTTSPVQPQVTPVQPTTAPVQPQPAPAQPTTAPVQPQPTPQLTTPSAEQQPATPQHSNLEEPKNNLRNLQKSNIKEPNFLILDSNLNLFICPDKPILTVKNYNDGIGFGGLNTSGSKYLFLIYGYLSNGYDFSNNTMTLLDMTKDEIKFYLKITDNLEDPDNRKKSVKCHIPTGTSINKNVLIEVKCIGSRAKLGNNNTDLILNWNLEENNIFDNVVVNWPYDLTKKKHIFFYNIQGLSVKKDGYGCFENKFYFYLYVYDLKAEPKISFNLPLVYPKNTNAECKLYNSVTFKCVIDLRLKKLSKGGKVVLSNDVREYLPNNEQNIVLYYVDNTTSSSELDFMLPVDENCGDFVLIGALKDVGYTYLQVIIIIICSFVGFLICIFGIAFCVIYEITHRNKKGPYFRYAEEKELPNTSNVSQTKPPA